MYFLAFTHICTSNLFVWNMILWLLLGYYTEEEMKLNMVLEIFRRNLMFSAEIIFRHFEYLKIRSLIINPIAVAAILKFDEQEVTILTKDMTLCDKHRHQRHCDWETPRDNIRVCSLCCDKASNCCNSCRSPTPTRHQPSPERNSNISSSFRIQSLFKKRV